MDDKELKKIDREEAEEKLDDEEFERWKDLREEKLENELDQFKSKRNEENSKAMSDLIKASKDELTTTVNISGFELKALLKLDKKQRQLLQDLRKLKNQFDDIEELDEEKLKELSDKLKEFLTTITPEYSLQDWNDFEEELGVGGLNEIGGDIVEAIFEERDNKKEEIKKFR